MSSHSRLAAGVLYLPLMLEIAITSGCGSLLQSNSLAKESKQLPRVPPPRSAIRFQVAFVERPGSDPLLGEALWRDIDQVGVVRPQTRAALRSAGLRVGQVGSTPPMVLQDLLGYRSQGEDEVEQRQADGLSVLRFTLQSGADTEIQLNPGFYPHCVLATGALEKNQNQSKSFDNVRCVLRMQAERLQDGWVRLRFTPEIHHGEQRLRYAVSGANLQRRTQQEIERFYEQEFRIDVTLGEMAVITADEPARNCLGTLFFVGPDNSKLQRLVVIRLADMRRVDPVYAE